MNTNQELIEGVKTLQGIHKAAVSAYQAEIAGLKGELQKKVAADTTGLVNIRELATKVASDLADAGSLQKNQVDAFVQSVVDNPDSLGSVYTKIASFQEPATDFGSSSDDMPSSTGLSPQDQAWARLIPNVRA